MGAAIVKLLKYINKIVFSNLRVCVCSVCSVCVCMLYAMYYDHFFRLFGLYMFMHHRMHSRIVPVKIFYHVGGMEALLGWVGVELYTVMCVGGCGVVWCGVVWCGVASRLMHFISEITKFNFLVD